jgi:hypothetical protein
MYSRKVRWYSRNADRYGSIKDINENCLAEFRTHWQCLENHNQQLWNCRSEERKMNKCVFEKLVCWTTNLTMSKAYNLSENGEDDTRCAQRRDTSPPAHTQHLCDSLSFVYIPPEMDNQGELTTSTACVAVTIFVVDCLHAMTKRSVCCTNIYVGQATCYALQINLTSTARFAISSFRDTLCHCPHS